MSLLLSGHKVPQAASAFRGLGARGAQTGRSHGQGAWPGRRRPRAGEAESAYVSACCMHVCEQARLSEACLCSMASHTLLCDCTQPIPELAFHPCCKMSSLAQAAHWGSRPPSAGHPTRAPHAAHPRLAKSVVSAPQTASPAPAPSTAPPLRLPPPDLLLPGSGVPSLLPSPSGSSPDFTMRPEQPSLQPVSSHPHSCASVPAPAGWTWLHPAGVPGLRSAGTSETPPTSAPLGLCTSLRPPAGPPRPGCTSSNWLVLLSSHTQHVRSMAAKEQGSRVCGGREGRSVGHKRTWVERCHLVGKSFFPQLVLRPVAVRRQEPGRGHGHVVLGR